jgi:hypothetical protein
VDGPAQRDRDGGGAAAAAGLLLRPCARSAGEFAADTRIVVRAMVTKGDVACARVNAG